MAVFQLLVIIFFAEELRVCAELLVPDKVTLNDGNTIPEVELGATGEVFKEWDVKTYAITENIISAIEFSEFRVIEMTGGTDARFRYQAATGRAMKYLIEKGVITRDEIYIISQVTPVYGWLYPLDGFGNAYTQIKDIIYYSELSHIDLYILTRKQIYKGKAYYNEDRDFQHEWTLMEQAKREGLTKSIGVGFFSEEQFDELYANCAIKPAVHLMDLPTPEQKWGSSLIESLEEDRMLKVNCPSRDPVYFVPAGTYCKDTLFLDFDYKGMYEFMMDDMLGSGYRHFDTSSELDMEVEQIIGDKINRYYGSIRHNWGYGPYRSDFTILTRLWNTDYKEEEVLPALKKALKRIQMHYVDYYIVNSPGRIDADGSEERDYIETWKGMLEVQRLGLARHIGLANFEPEHLERMNATFPNFNPCILENPPPLKYIKDLENLITKYEELDVKIMIYTHMTTMSLSPFTDRIVPQIIELYNLTSYYYMQGLNWNWRYDRQHAFLLTAYHPGLVMQIF